MTKLIAPTAVGDQEKMAIALEQAKLALKNDEVPIGAVVFLGDEIIGVGKNERNASRLATSHAEILAIVEASKKLNDWRLDAELFVTLEPCLMCLGACFNARIKRVVFGAYDTNSNSLASNFCGEHSNTLNHNLEILGGVLEEECSQLLTEYFKKKRIKGSE